jgi:hypothetical protein
MVMRRRKSEEEKKYRRKSVGGNAIRLYKSTGMNEHVCDSGIIKTNTATLS